jgi:hypothetical protein
MNMSAKILRNIVASTFKVDAKKIIISGDLGKNFRIEEKNNYGNLYSNHTELKVWAFCPNLGFIPVVGEYTGSSQNADSSYNKELTINYAHCCAHKDALFFVTSVKEEGWQTGAPSWSREVYTIYKAPS